MEKEITKSEKDKSIIKSDNFDERFSELEKISEKAKKLYLEMEKNDPSRRVQENNHRSICNC